VWDKALLMVTADHGFAFQVGVKDRRRVTRSNIQDVAPVPLFIKAPGQQGGRTLGQFVRTIDMLPTVADILNFKLRRVNGRSAFSRSVKRRRRIVIPNRGFTRKYRISTRRFAARRRKSLRRQIRLFGQGSAPLGPLGMDPRLFRFGPNADLVGRPTTALPNTGQGKVRASISNGTALNRVRRSAFVVPTHITGRITGAKRRSKRNYAVGVNGRIEAVGRTFYMKKDRRQYFASMVPETALRDGGNDVVIFEVDGKGSGRRLIPLGGA